jgi:hypothetical protein
VKAGMKEKKKEEEERRKEGGGRSESRNERAKEGTIHT